MICFVYSCVRRRKAIAHCVTQVSASRGSGLWLLLLLFSINFQLTSNLCATVDQSIIYLFVYGTWVYKIKIIRKLCYCRRMRIFVARASFRWIFGGLRFGIVCARKASESKTANGYVDPICRLLNSPKVNVLQSNKVCCSCWTRLMP